MRVVYIPTSRNLNGELRKSNSTRKNQQSRASVKSIVKRKDTNFNREEPSKTKRLFFTAESSIF